MAERDRQNPYWHERQDWRERLSRDDRQAQSWQAPQESRWLPEGGYASQRDYGERQYGGYGRQQAGYGDYSSRQSYDEARRYEAQREYGGGSQGYGPSGEAPRHTSYSSQTGYGAEWQRGYGGGSQGGYGGESAGYRGASQSGYGSASQTGYGGASQSGYGGGSQSGYGGASQTGYGGAWQSGYGTREQGRTFRRGPKNYRRSDERIREDICERLMQSDVDASDVTVSVADGKVILEGTVPERHMKHRIEDIAEGSFGVTDVDNNLRVSRGGWASSSADTRESSLVDGLNRCLRSELSAIETYRQALDRDRNEYGTRMEFQRLSEILHEHEDAAGRLRDAVQRMRGEPSTDSGAWGTWSKMVMGAAKLFGDRSALKALKEGEESGRDEYERFQHHCNPPSELFDLTSELMARQGRHIRELDSLMAAAERT